MTANKVIEIIDRLKPNAYSEEDKLRWINELETMVQSQIMQVDEVKELVYPDDMDTELVVKAPFDDIYSLYVEAKIDYYNRELQNYNNSALMFEAQYGEFKKDYIRRHQVKEWS